MMRPTATIAGALANSELRRLLATTSYELPVELTTRQRLALLCHTDATISEIEAMADSDFTVHMLLRRGVTAQQIIEAGLDGGALRRMGCTDVHTLRQLGFDALSLTYIDGFVESCVDAFGLEPTRDAFLCTARDAVDLAGSAAAETLLCGATTLLTVCEGTPVQATAVLEQLGRGACDGVPCSVLVRAGLTSEILTRLGVSLTDLLHFSSPSTVELSALGYRM